MKVYEGTKLDLIAYPMGGLGAGNVCLQGTGRIGNISVRNRPDYQNDPNLFAALCVKGETNHAKVLEASVPDSWKFVRGHDAGNGRFGTNFGLPRFSEGSFSARFPFAEVNLKDNTIPITAKLTGWSPFIPNDEDASGLPVAAVEYSFHNPLDRPADAVFYFSAVNFMGFGEGAFVRRKANGFVLEQPAIPGVPGSQGAFCISTDDPDVCTDAGWFRGKWFDSLTMLWKEIEAGQLFGREHPADAPSLGGTLGVPFTLPAGGSKTITVRLCWHVPYSDQREGLDYPAPAQLSEEDYYRPWYASVYRDIDALEQDWTARYAALRSRTAAFTACFYDTTLPEEIVDAIAANLCILKSPTLLRQYDGRFWGWEGCADRIGQCAGSCTHVYNYAQAVCNLFPRLERTLRETELFETQHDDTGMQNFRAYLPIRKTTDFAHPPAADGQLGGIIKLYRDWRISGDTDWLRRLWPKARHSLQFCIDTWDPDEAGVIRTPHHNTYDIEFWGPDSMCNSYYLGALRAAAEICDALGEDGSYYQTLFERAKAFLETALFNGEYFQQIVERDGRGFEAFAVTEPNEENARLLEAEGPKYQIGSGCLSDSLTGLWLSRLSGLGRLLDADKEQKNLASIYRYNFKRDFSEHVNPQRPGYALNKDAGLVVCSWPHGEIPSLPMVYTNEVFTGIEYQAASHMLLCGMEEEGLALVAACRGRYEDGSRNPFNEYEWGHWYVRALACYALIGGYTGLRYDKLTRTLYLHTRNTDSFRAFLSTDGGYGTVEFQSGQVSIHPIEGEILVEKIQLEQ